MSVLDDDGALQAEALARSYVRAYLETDATFADIVAHYGDGPEDYVGRRRARECPDPALHARLDRAPAQELRFPSQAKPGMCRWCEGLLPEED